MLIGSIAEFEALTGEDAPRPVERALIEKCRAGEPLRLGDLPEEGKPDPKFEIRADLLRLLITGGTPACRLHPKGVWLEGARITGTLDLRFATGRGGMVLNKCRFVEEPRLEQARIALLSLDGSALPGLYAQGIEVEGSVYLRDVTASGTVDVLEARIGGQFNCDRARLHGGKDRAINAQGARIGNSLYLRNVTANGTIDLLGARIGGQLACSGSTLNGNKGKALHAQGAQIGSDLFLDRVTAAGTVDVSGANIDGQLALIGATLDGGTGMALLAQRLKVTKGFLFRNLKAVTGQINLDAAHVSDLFDDAPSWPVGQGQLYLNGFTYDRIAGDEPLTLAARKDWLERGSRFKGVFHPQPYTQFAKVLREAGHEAEARLVLRERERLLTADRLPRDRAAIRAALAGDQTRRAEAGPIWLRMQGARAWSWATGSFAGYGYAPGLALIWSFAILCLATIVYAISWDAGLMVPNSAIILTSADWTAAHGKDALAPALHWTGPAAAHYETFYAIPYALDVYLPVVDLGQHSAWTQTTATTAGALIRVFTWALQASGYIVTGLGLAAATGLIQRDKD